uniref:DUF1758 domain-containing protein n=1 Tax=Loa loa TaxID=7209 RepID=A0A1I7W2M4_LOALO
MITIENIERVLRQLEALGDNLEHPSIETIIESKMPPWILNKVYTQRKIDKPWTIQKLRNFLSDLVEVNQQVKIDQYSNFRADNKPTTIKGEQKRMYRLERISALSTMQTNHRETRSQKAGRDRAYFAHVITGIVIVISIQRRDMQSKKRCFYCKASHNSALCEKRSTPTLNITTLPKKQESIYPDKKESEPQTNKAKDILLLCKEIGVFNPVHPQKQRRALALFDIGSQLSFISKKLSSQLQLAESDHRNMLVAPFGTKEPLQCPTANAQLSICTVDNEIITINTHVVEYLTEEIQIVDISFVDLQDKKELRSGYIMVHSKVGPMITGEGYIDELCNSKGHSIPIICSMYTNPNSELEKFWRLEMIGIHESPTEDDDERAMDHFNKTIIKLDGRYQRLNSSSHLHDYDNTIKDQLLRGVIEVPPNDEVDVVLTPHKNTTQIRIVYDASARRGFKSFNEVLYRGPVILPDLVGILLRFRAMKIVITADIEKAFLQIELQEEERSNTSRIQEVTDSSTNYNKVKGMEIEELMALLLVELERLNNNRLQQEIQLKTIPLVLRKRSS